MILELKINWYFSLYELVLRTLVILINITSLVKHYIEGFLQIADTFKQLVLIVGLFTRIHFYSI